MALVPYPDEATLSKEAAKILDLAPANITKMMAGMGPTFVPLMKLAATFFNEGALDPRLRELLTLRIGYQLNAKYMIAQHERMAKTLGVTTQEMAAVKEVVPNKVFSEVENKALIVVDQLIFGVKAHEDDLLAAYAALGESAFHEMFVILGFYHMAARFLESLKIEIDAGAHGDPLENMSRV